MIAHWQRKELVVKTGSGYEITADPEQLAAVSVPERIQKAITGRLDNLPPVELLLLKTGGTIGVNFTLTELEARYPIAAERGHLAGALAHLEQLQLIRPVVQTAEPAYTFIYGCIQEVANNLLPHSLRERLVIGG
jgi:hypothetical protein